MTDDLFDVCCAHQADPELDLPGCHCTAPSEPPVEAGELDCCGGSYDDRGEAHYTDCRATQPPAEAQQDDGGLPWHVDALDSHRIADRDGAGVATAFSAADATRVVCLANAARPSADTETLRALADRWDDDADSWDAVAGDWARTGPAGESQRCRHLAETCREHAVALRAALDGTR